MFPGDKLEDQILDQEDRITILEREVSLTTGSSGGEADSLEGPVHLSVKNTTSGTLTKGTAVYATGSVGASGAVEVQVSDNTNTATMPSLGLLDADLASNAVGSATILGVIREVDTSSYSINDELWVSTSGGLTNTRPTSGLIQKIGRVVRVHATTGEILVLGAGRTNDVPFPLYVDHTNQRVGIGTTSPNVTLDVRGGAYIDDDLTVNQDLDAGSTTITGSLSVSGDVDLIGSSRAIMFGRQDEGGPHGLEAHTTSGLEGALYYRTSPNSWAFEDSSGTKIAEFDVDDALTTFGGNVTSAHHFTAQSGGADGGIVLGQAFSSSYVGLRTAGMAETGSEYVIMSSGNNTFISAGTTGDVYIRGGGNSSSCQIVLDTSANYVNITGNVALAGALQVTASGGDINFFNNALIASEASSTNIDHIWHDETNNAWNFCSDTTYKAAGNSKIVAGASSFSDRMIIRANGSDILTLEDSGGTNESGYINFANSSGTSLGYIGYGNNDDIHIKNNDAGGNIYMGVANGWAIQISTSRHLLPYSDNAINLGQSGRAWNHFYLHQGNQFSSGGYWTLRSRDSDRQVMELVSSERYKKDIVDMPLTEAYQVLDARVIKYRGIDDDETVPLEAGLSAESLHNAGYEYAVRYDEGHWGETPRSIYYEYLTVPLIRICQDQRDLIQALETRVAALEA